MDSINVAYIALRQSLSDNNILKMELDALSKRLEISEFSNDYFESDNIRLLSNNDNLKNQLDIKDQLHQNELVEWKQKAKARFTSFLFGAGVGFILAFIGVMFT